LSSAPGKKLINFGLPHAALVGSGTCEICIWATRLFDTQEEDDDNGDDVGV
jgi:hypothetical protein